MFCGGARPDPDRYAKAGATPAPLASTVPLIDSELLQIQLLACLGFVFLFPSRYSYFYVDSHFMSWQSAARGGFLRTLHRGALSPRTGVSDLQNQLGRVCLAAKSGSAHPQFQSLSQSNSFATASTPLKASKTPKAKKADNTAKKSALSEEQQEKQKAKELRAHIKQLKETALIKRPKSLPTSAFSLGFVEKLREIKGQYPAKEGFLIGVEHAKSLDPQDKERLQAQARANVAANAVAYDAWVKSYAPLQIRDANSARLTLSRISGKNYPSIRDDRLPKIPNSAYILFAKDRLDTQGYQGKSGRETFTAISEDWTRLPQSEKDRYHRLQIEDRHRYEREYEEVYGLPAPKSPRYKSPEDYK
ncbi:High mobility group, superfamily [Penicillium italicum]|uniref:High mobility group, superfamily n=1 Tax=Penicillium italicum TaxID=40296 RepID=A0A0A2L5J9_PENIT|nr:High mobility group, superfamily [Penicillium italicum]